MTFLVLLLQVLVVAIPAQAYRADGGNFGWRMLCGSHRDITRYDPIASPNEASAHAHIFHGASRIYAASSYEDLRSSQCTTCEVEQDKSAYWVPALYWQGADGKYTAVRQLGGIQTYYWIHDDNVRAFPPGFRMLAGDSSRRNSSIPDPDKARSFWTAEDKSEDLLRQRALGFNCLHYTDPPTNEPTLMRHQMPDGEAMKKCKDGMRVEVVFPACWDGKNVDSEDHKSHVAYSDMVINGNCPESHPVRIPALMYEVIFAVQEHFGENQGKFVFSNGDETGLGNHADFMNGWDESLLQNALNHCRADTGNMWDCPLFTMNRHMGESCEAENYKPLEVVRKEKCSGLLSFLCGGKKSLKDAPARLPLAQPAPEAAPPAPVPQPLPLPGTPLSPVPEAPEPVVAVASRPVGPALKAQQLPPSASPEPPALPSAQLPSSQVTVESQAPTTMQAVVKESPPPSAVTSAPPIQVTTVVKIEEVTVFEDVYTTVWERRKRHVHHHHHQRH